MAHLSRALETVGVGYQLYCRTKKTETRIRDFGYGLQYRNLSSDDIVRVEGMSVVAALQKNYLDETKELLRRGAYIIIHDPTELKKDIRDLILDNQDKVIVIRKANLKHIHGATFIPHPYVRRYKDEPPAMECNAISISRIDFDKRTDIILEANRLVPENKRVDIRGFDGRIYSRLRLLPRFPEYKQSVNRYPREFDYAVNLCRKYRYHVDMSEIKGDGGGTQFTYLEATDSGCVSILNSAWILPGEAMKPGENCLAISSPEELAWVLKYGEKHFDLDKIRQNARNYIERSHNPKRVGKFWKKFLFGK